MGQFSFSKFKQFFMVFSSLNSDFRFFFSNIYRCLIWDNIENGTILVFKFKQFFRSCSSFNSGFRFFLKYLSWFNLGQYWKWDNLNFLFSMIRFHHAIQVYPYIQDSWPTSFLTHIIVGQQTSSWPPWLLTYTILAPQHLFGLQAF